MSLKHFFQHAHTIHLRMYEFEFEYISGRNEYEITLAYVVATNETEALQELKQEILKHKCTLQKVKGFAKRIEPGEFDQYISSRWPEYLHSLVSKNMIRDHDHHVYVLPSIKLSQR